MLERTNPGVIAENRVFHTRKDVRVPLTDTDCIPIIPCAPVLNAPPLIKEL